MNAEILAVGTELLLGDILNTNAQYISKELAGLGIGVYYQTVVGDNEERLLSAYKTAFERADMVITTGGLGPTEDDLTKETAAKYFNKEMVLDEASWNTITEYFQKQNFTMTQNNKKQAYFPEGARILDNPKGTAPGCMIEENGKILFNLPGPPMEAIPMFDTAVRPILLERSDTKFISRTLRICGVGESSAEDMLKDLIDAQTNPTIAPYAKLSEVTLRLTANAKTEEEGQAIIEPVAKEIYRRLGDNVYNEGEVTLEETVVQLLEKKNMTIAIAESCTGGLLTSTLVDVPGVSKVLKEGLVTYSNESKVQRLGVKEETLKKFGAVSEETALEMAEGVAKTLNANIGIAITGVAGPDGGTDEKPVGLIYIGMYIDGKKSVKKMTFKGDRKRIRGRTVVNALDAIRRALL